MHDPGQRSLLGTFGLAHNVAHILVNLVDNVIELIIFGMDIQIWNSLS